MVEGRRIRLGELLVEAGLLQPADLERALELQKSDRRRLGKLLLAEGLVDEAQLTQILSHQLSVPWVSLHHIEFSRQLLNLVPAAVADTHGLVPIYVRHVRGQGQTLYLAMEDPSDEDGLGACRSHSGLPVRPMIASPSEIRRAIFAYYGIGDRPKSKPTPARRASVNAPAPIAETNAEVPAEPGAAAPIAAGPPVAALAAPHLTVEQAITPPTVATLDPSQGSSPTGDDGAAAPGGTMTRKETLMGHGPPPPSSGASAVMKALASAAEPKPRLQLASEPDVVFEDEEPQVSSKHVRIPAPAGGRAPRMVALTLLDGTTLQLPARGGTSRTREPSIPAPPTGPAPSGSDLTARDLVSALRAVSHGADATEVLGENVRWEAMFAAMLSLLLRKHLIADWEFVEEYKKY